MTPYRRFSSLPQLAAAVFVFAATMLLVDSGGLYSWAQRLDLGPERTVAVPAASALHRTVGRLGLEQLRTHALISLAHVRWSDDAALLAASAPPSPQPQPHPQPQPSAPGSTSSTGSPTPAPLPSKPPTTPDPAPAALPAPPLTSTLPAIPLIAPNQTRTVALAGDSMMAVGLSSTILRDAPRFPSLTFLKTFKSGTGLARPEVYNWQVEYPAMLKAAQLRNAPPDFILVAIGANDGQGFVDSGITYPFGSPGWQTIYQQRVEAYLAMLQASGATVIWLGLPPMKSATYDSKIDLVNRIDAAVIAATPHTLWFSTAGIVGDASGHFRDFGTFNGKTIRLRQGDGIHLSDEGAALVADKLLPWLAKQEKLTPQETPVAAPPPSPAVKPPGSTP